jgi:hypothetical protein
VVSIPCPDITFCDSLSREGFIKYNLNALEAINIIIIKTTKSSISIKPALIFCTSPPMSYRFLIIPLPLQELPKLLFYFFSNSFIILSSLSSTSKEKATNQVITPKHIAIFEILVL